MDSLVPSQTILERDPGDNKVVASVITVDDGKRVVLRHYRPNGQRLSCALAQFDCP
jgi:hypothetical protein